MRFVLCWLLSSLLLPGLLAQETHYDEARVPAYELIDPLLTREGQRIDHSQAWERLRRPELLALFEQEVYGQSPLSGWTQAVTRLDSAKALDGRAIRKQLRIRLSRHGQQQDLLLLLYLPVDAAGPVPLFLGLNFYGNHTLHDDPGILLTEAWLRNNEDFNITENRATDASRGVRHYRWPIEDILAQGFGLASIYCGDIDPDYDDGFENGVHALWPEASQHPAAWGTVAAWAWGLSRGLDYLQTDPQVDRSRVAVFGHSRLGKAALWAGATDPRFAFIIANESGCGGAALSKRAYGETVQVINERFPHWFCDNFSRYNGRELALPLDQHLLIALMAPRPVYVASAEDDQWADPTGEYLAAYHAGPVYRLYGLAGLGMPSPPATDQPRWGEGVYYHRRSGPHDVKDFDWQQYLEGMKREIGE